MAPNCFSFSSTRGSITLPTNVNTQPCVQVTVLRVYVFASTCSLMRVTAEHSSARFGNCVFWKMVSIQNAQISPKPKWESFAVLFPAWFWWGLRLSCTMLALERCEGIRLSISSVAEWLFGSGSQWIQETNFNNLHRKHEKKNRRGNHWMYS